jgi:hypothetical protein
MQIRMWAFPDHTPDHLDRYRASPDYPIQLGLIHTIPRERRAGPDWRFTPDSYRSLATPTLLLVGSETS